MLLSQLKKGEDYSDLNRTVTINILNFNYLEGEKFIKCYSLFEKDTKMLLTDLLEIIFIELPKFNMFKESRKDIQANKDYNEKLYKGLTLEKYDTFDLLKKSGGRLPTDSLEFIDPIFLGDSNIVREFYVAGVSHYDFLVHEWKRGCIKDGFTKNNTRKCTFIYST